MRLNNKAYFPLHIEYRKSLNALWIRLLEENMATRTPHATTTSEQLYNSNVPVFRCTRFSLLLICSTLQREGGVGSTSHNYDSEPHCWSSAFKGNKHQRSWRSYLAEEVLKSIWLVVSQKRVTTIRQGYDLSIHRWKVMYMSCVLIFVNLTIKK